MLERVPGAGHRSTGQRGVPRAGWRWKPRCIYRPDECQHAEFRSRHEHRQQYRWRRVLVHRQVANCKVRTSVAAHRAFLPEAAPRQLPRRLMADPDMSRHGGTERQILVADGDPVVRSALRLVLGRAYGLHAVREASTAEDLLTRVTTSAPERG